MNNNTVIALKRVMSREADSQSQFASMAGVERPTLVNDLQQNRKIPDERFGQYLQAVSKEGQMEILRGRLLDLIPEPLRGHLLSQDTFTEGDIKGIPHFPAQVSKEIKHCLEWLAKETIKDSNLENLIILFCEQVGWKPSSKRKIQY